MFGSTRDGDASLATDGDSPEIRAQLDTLERYWRQIRRADRLPQRTDVDPARIDSCLPHSFIVERIAPGVLRLRVAGSRLSETLGMEVRGMPLSALFLPEGRAFLDAQVDAVFDGPRIMEFGIRSPHGLGRPLLAGRLLLLPLLDRNGKVTRAMGAIITEGEIGRGARRFTIPEGLPVRSEPADGEARLTLVVRPDPGPGVPTFGAPSKTPHSAPRADRPAVSGEGERPAAPAGHPFLRLVVSNS